MKLKFGHKVFLTYLFNGLVVVGCMVLIARHYALRNFEEYVVKMEMERLDEMAASLGREYGKNGNWETLQAGLGNRFDERGLRPEQLEKEGILSGRSAPFPPPPPGPAAARPHRPGEPPPIGGPPLPALIPQPGPPPARPRFPGLTWPEGLSGVHDRSPGPVERNKAQDLHGL